MTPDEAHAYRAAHDAEVKALAKMTRAQLATLETAGLRDAGQVRIMGGPASKDELIRAIIDRKYPREQMNLASHVLYHKPGERWSACQICGSLPVDIHEAGGGVSHRPACGCPPMASCAAPGVPAGSQVKARNRWFCPVCGGPLSYGVYCKRCRTETSFAWRPATDKERALAELRALIQSLPVPSYPEYAND